MGVERAMEHAAVTLLAGEDVASVQPVLQVIKGFQVAHAQDTFINICLA